MPNCIVRRRNVHDIEGKAMKIQHQVYFAEFALQRARATVCGRFGCEVARCSAHG